MKRLALIGAGDLGRRIAYQALNDKHYQPVGFFDDFIEDNKLVNGLPVLGKVNDIQSCFDLGLFDLLMVSIGYRYFDLREELFNRFKDRIPFGTILHSSVCKDKSCETGAGVFVNPGCVLDLNARIDQNAIIGTACVISHDSKIGSHSWLSPSVTIAGCCEIGQKVNLGVGTTVIDHIKISDGIQTGAGTVVVENLEVKGLYIGVPARLLRAF
ncbi:MAG TPA: NeuD/PglB/VioB family sugar acetyltransferase [Bacteroidales bacterium]|nr:NeuD/PglB/VioB family sugar acetyltransferase [Bacteroidales bacterium]HQK68438.1 NeuD/PglB/VioB family sugar acetyltransferase [Bacteroidales bacterium]